MSRGRKSGSKTIPQSWHEIYLKNIGFYFRKLIFELGLNDCSGIEPAVELLQEIKSEKQKLGKKEVSLPPIRPDEIPFKIPDNWVWCRLGEMSINLDGLRKPIALSDRENRVKTYDYYGASGVIDKIDGYTHEGELLLIGEDGANLISRSTPIAFLAKGKFWVNNHAHVLDTIHRITLDYLCAYINSIDLKPFITGGFQPKLSQGNLNLIPVPLPPLIEQENIISFLNNFEEQNVQKGYSYFDKTIEERIFSLHHKQIIGYELKSELKLQLTQIENLNQAILQEAVQGKLVKQDMVDEPASEQLKRIKTAKAASGRKEKPLPPIKPEEIPFEIPVSWMWCRLGDMVESYQNGISTRGTTAKTSAIVIRLADIKNSKVDISDTRKINLSPEIINKYKLEKTDILITRVNGSVELVGNFNYVGSHDYDVTACDHFIRMRMGLDIDVSYFYLLGKAKHIRHNIENSFKTTSGQKTINQGHIDNLLIPLPPLPEQKRIVAEIEKQLAKTKQLKDYIIANQQATEQLLKALLHQGFDVEEKPASATKKATGKLVHLPADDSGYDNLVAEDEATYGQADN